jgi:pilus assembly protein FimV
MDENEKNPPQTPQSDKKLKLDLSEALNPGVDDDDDIIELKDEVTLPPMEKEEEFALIDTANEDMQADEPAAATIVDLDALSEETDDEAAVAHLDDTLTFDEEDEDMENVAHLADDLAFKEEDEDQAEILPPLNEEPLKTDAADEVVEITEFDDFLSDDSNEMMTLSDIAEELEPEEEFLELIDVEEDNVPETVAETAREEIEDDIIQFDGPGADDDAELEDFINDSLGEEMRIDDDFEDDLTSALGVKAGSAMNMTDPSADAEEFDFDIDSSEISEKIEHLETIFFDESEAENELDEDAESEVEAIGSAGSDAADETDEISEKIDRLETIFFDESEAEDELDEDAEPEAEAIGSDGSDAADETDEISEKIDRLGTTFFDEYEAETELDEDTEPEAEAIGSTVSDAADETDEISEKINRLETTFFDEYEAETELDEDAESQAQEIEAAVSETGDETDAGDMETTDVEPSGEPLADDALAALAGASQEQIEQSIERIIQQNFSDKIESLVTETIEKAVSKEIDRLKNILLDDGSDNNV